MSIKNIVFDLGGVLIDLNRNAAVEAFSQIGFHRAAELLDPYLQRGIFLQMERGEISTAEFHSYVHSQIADNTTVTDNQIDSALNKFLIGIPSYKLTMLLELRKRFKVYMLSNTNEIAFNYVKQSMFTSQGLGVDDYFDQLFLSYKMKVLKPDPEIFRKMIEQTGICESETLFIDDSKANINTARELGLNVYLAKENEDFRELFKNI